MHSKQNLKEVLNSTKFLNEYEFTYIVLKRI